MSNSNKNDKADRKSNSAPAPTYKVGNKKPPLQTRFKPGQSGNPSGRPKGRSNFRTTVLKEFRKSTPATINGKPIKVTNEDLFARSLIKDAITKGPQSKVLMLNILSQQEAHEAAEAEARKKAAVAEPVRKFDWTEEQEKLFRELASANGFEVQES
jgi:Family of unknown function (DUF5681)